MAEDYHVEAGAGDYAFGSVVVAAKVDQGAAWDVGVGEVLRAREGVAVSVMATSDTLEFEIRAYETSSTQTIIHSNFRIIHMRSQSPILPNRIGRRKTMHNIQLTFTNTPPQALRNGPNNMLDKVFNDTRIPKVIKYQPMIILDIREF